jgi:hypothetical protein
MLKMPDLAPNARRASKNFPIQTTNNFPLLASVKKNLKTFSDGENFICNLKKSSHFMLFMHILQQKTVNQPY